MGPIPNTGVKEFLMTLRNYRDLIETFEFGAQFSIFSGFRLVLAAMDENETLQQLIGELRSSKIWRKALLNLVKAILRSESNDSQIAFDGCIAAYLYCLWKADLSFGYATSNEVLNTRDLWWSAKLALLVRKEFLESQIAKSVKFESLESEPLPYASEGNEYPLHSNSERYTFPQSSLWDSGFEARGVELGQVLTGKTNEEYVEFPTFSRLSVYNVGSNSKQAFKMFAAS